MLGRVLVYPLRAAPLAVLKIHTETADYLVVEKPPHQPVHPSRPGEIGTLWNALRGLLAFEIANGGQVSIINRLDRETSGLTLVAKHRAAARLFGKEMEARRIVKRYQAVCWGWPQAEAWTVDLPLARQGATRASPIHLKRAVDPQGDAARTRFEVLRRFVRPTSAGDRFCVVAAYPETGRTHQIRVHLAHSGHPIVGDKIYGPDEQCYLEFIRTGWTAALAERLLLPRHALHSSALAIPALELHWECGLPEDLAAFTLPESGTTG